MFNKLNKQKLLFSYAVSFFSRIPVSSKTDFTAYPFHLGNLYFPVVGAISALLSFIVFSLSSLVFDPVTSSILMLMSGLLLTGALHEDGFADTCDGLGGGYNKKQCLAIMKDSQIGTYGVLGLIVLFALKVSVLSQLGEQEPWLFFRVLVCAAVVSRFSALLLIQYSAYAREHESSKSIASSQQLPMKYLFTAFLFSLASMFLIPSTSIFLIIAVVFLNSYLCKQYFNKKIEGYTGDCLGFLQQLNELSILLISLAWYSGI